MHFKTKKATYKVVSVDNVNVIAYNIKDKTPLIVNVDEFNMRVNKCQVQMINFNVVDSKFKIPKT